MTLPQYVLDLVENKPVEDFMLALLRDGLPGIAVQSLIAAKQSFPFVMVRRVPGMGEGVGDMRFLDSALVEVHVLTDGVNADEDSALLSEAIRVILRDAWLGRTSIPERGQLCAFEMTRAPRRAPDWATSSGPVQYADLPSGIQRYETQYAITIRRSTR